MITSGPLAIDDSVLIVPKVEDSPALVVQDGSGGGGRIYSGTPI